ncbi:TonB-dependent receptor [Sphingomonas sp. BIUV-7]|uniref:TonB-dependent receptor n=1 Tax=Sphingomonas natans TaxID=3063330 RepID=A0ABT8YBP3_9SPHN|nr:TonB-dependent receptor [Sphingomonas sp. BIUV-7]MDO6415065.1 TonB-dependent receptor [Sphingomonas sp. BIUV-7]
MFAIALLAAVGAAGVPDVARDAEAEILVTATQRATALSDVPIAVTAIGAEALRDGGVVDIRTLNMLAPSLLVSSSSNEAGGAGLRIRGIGTVGDNAGLESSVATFVDGVYRARGAVALTELGPLERIEVLRGPQGTLFGRNASAGLINIVTAQPSRTLGGFAEASVGNYDYRRLSAGITGPLGEHFSARIDGVNLKRQGFIEDVVSGRHINDRDRWLLRGKLRFEPDASFAATLTVDYARRDEECCAGVYNTVRDLRSSTPGAAGGSLVTAPSSIAALIRAMPGGVVLEDSSARKVALSPGQSFRQDVTDGGIALNATKTLGGVTIDSITAWRSNRFIRGQDADFSSLDLIRRPSDGTGFIRFRNFSQELRARGEAFGGRLDWLVGGYWGEERLTLQDNMAYGADYDRLASARIGALGGAFAAFPAYGFANLSGFARAYGGDALAAAVRNVPLAGTGELDRFRQHDSNQALFTHDIVHVTDRLSLTLGARYTRDRKTLDADLSSTSGCGIYLDDIARLRALGTASAVTLANSVLAPLTGYPCNINAVNGAIHERRAEHRWSGTAALGYRVAAGANVYASWSRGYKAGGFNLDRGGLFNTGRLLPLPAASLGFAPETVDAIELGAKLHRRLFDVDVALFHQRFRNFQLNSYTGTNFIVSNVQGCSASLGSRDADNIAANSTCTDTKAGVISKGVEVDAALRPAADWVLSGGFAYADTRYAKDIVGSPDALTGDNSLPPVLFLLPGARLSNAPAYSATGSVRWTPAIGDRLRALAYVGGRYQSRINTGSDLLAEKAQKGFGLVDARIGIGDGQWSLELWAQNLFNVQYKQVVFSEPLQGGGSGGMPGTAAAVTAFGTTSNQLFGAFLGEPRTWGLTARKRF